MTDLEWYLDTVFCHLHVFLITLHAAGNQLLFPIFYFLIGKKTIVTLSPWNSGGSWRNSIRREGPGSMARCCCVYLVSRGYLHLIWTAVLLVTLISPISAVSRQEYSCCRATTMLWLGGRIAGLVVADRVSKDNGMLRDAHCYSPRQYVPSRSLTPSTGISLLIIEAGTL